MRTERDAILSLQRFVAGVLPAPWDVRVELEAGAPPVRPFVLVEQIANASTTGAPAMQDLMIPFAVNLFPVQDTTREGAMLAALDLRELVWQAVKWGPDPRHPTTDRIPLFAYQDRLEQHRFRWPHWMGDTGFVITVAGVTTTDPLTRASTADDVADAIEAAMIAGGRDLQVGDVTGVDRGTGLWDVYYGGTLAGVRIGDPEIFTTTMVEPDVWPDASPLARTMLQGAPSPWRGPSDYMRVDDFAQNTIADQADPTLVMIAVDLRLTFTRSLPLPSDLKILQRIFSSADPGG